MKKHLNITNFCAQALLASCALTVGFGAAAQTSKAALPADAEAMRKVSNEKNSIAAAAEKAQQQADAKAKAAADKAAAEKAAADKAAADKAVVGTHGMSKPVPVAVKK